MKIKYAVIILNYNTIEEAINAAESVKKNATTDSFVICIADNYSTKATDRQLCENYKSEHVITVCLDKNNGYAKGNNKAIRFLTEKYNPDYYVIMNPDVNLMQRGTIEGIINRLEIVKGNVVGGQPIVWNCNNSNSPENQQNIRRVPNYKDICMLSFLPLKFVEKERYNRMIYADDMPFSDEIQYRVPSGAFFIIRSDIFEAIGLFDENTFLYYEEHIIGKKLELIDKNLLFMPQYIVKHEHGKSTGNNHYKINKFAKKCEIDSRLYYAQKYLNCSQKQLNHIYFLSNVDKIFEYMNILFNRITQ